MITYEELESRMAVLLGGRAAEWIVFNHLSTGAVDDLAKVMDIARDMVMRFGMEKSLGPVSYESPRSPFLMGAPAPKGWNERRYGDQTAHAIGAAVQPIIEKSFERTVSILKNHRDRLERGAKLLLEKETLDETELRKRRVEPQTSIPGLSGALPPRAASGKVKQLQKSI